MTQPRINIIAILMFSVVISVLVSLAVWRINSPPQFAKPNDLFSTIKARGSIRAAYNVDAPLFIIDPNSGSKSGIFYEITTRAADHLGLKVEWTAEVGYGEMVEGLRARQYDIIGSGVWINADRSRGADFTNPVYYDAIFAYARTGDKRILSDLSNLDSPGFTISTMDGELGASIARQDFSKAKTLSLPQNSDFSQLITNVVDRKADIVFLASAPAQAYQAVNPGKIYPVDAGRPIRVFPNALMIPPGQFEFREAFNHALMEMQNDGEIDSILSKYEKSPGSYLRLASPYRSELGAK